MTDFHMTIGTVQYNGRTHLDQRDTVAFIRRVRDALIEEAQVNGDHDSPFIIRSILDVTADKLENIRPL